MRKVGCMIPLVLLFLMSEVRPQPTLAAEDVAVLGVVLGDCSKRDEGSYYVVSSRALSPHDFMLKALPSTIEGRTLLERNARVSQLPAMPPCPGIRVEAEEDIVAALKAKAPPTDPPQPGWEGFYARYPGARGVFRVSLPGYTQDGSGAVVIVSAACGPLCGSGVLLHLEKTTGKWQIVRRQTLWVS
jgi:hypothetical protein